MERYNIFQLIHKGLRASLYQTALQLQQTDFVAEEDTENAINKVKEIVMLFDGHAHKEDKYVLPAIAAYEPSVVADFETEHETDIQLGEELHTNIERLDNSTSPSARIAAGNLLTEC